MSYLTRTRATLRDRELAQFATSLLTYAQIDQRFAEALAHHCQQFTVTTPRLGTNAHSIPDNQESAVAHTRWLLQTLKHDAKQFPYTKSILAEFAGHYHAPKDQVFGIIGIAIIGPTLGLIKKKKKKKSQLRVIVDAAWYKNLSTKEKIDTVQAAALRAAAHELSRAGGDTNRLHPDTAEWLMAEHETAVYQADTSELQTVNAALHTDNLIYTTQKTANVVNMLTISPSTNQDFIYQFNLKRL
jgi:hypothetical protein